MSQVSSFAGLGFYLVPLHGHAPWWKQPTSPTCPSSLSNLALRSSSHFGACSPSPSIAVGAAENREEFMKFEESRTDRARIHLVKERTLAPRSQPGRQSHHPAHPELRGERQPAPQSSQTQAFHTAPVPSPSSSVREAEALSPSKPVLLTNPGHLVHKRNPLPKKKKNHAPLMHESEGVYFYAYLWMSVGGNVPTVCVSVDV